MMLRESTRGRLTTENDKFELAVVGNFAFTVAILMTKCHLEDLTLVAIWWSNCCEVCYA